MVAIKVERIRECDYLGSLNDHHVCLVEAKGDPNLKGHELDRFTWWDMNEPIPVFAHVKAILSKLDGMGRLDKH